MRALLVSATLALCSPSAPAQEQPKESPAPEQKRDFADLSRLIHTVVVKELPKDFEDKTGWGQLAPLTERLRFPNLPRTRVRIGDKEGYPDGLWRKFKARIVDPSRDLRIDVRDFSKIDSKQFRLVVDSEAVLMGEGEVQNWLKGIPAGKAFAQADALIAIRTAFDVGVTLTTKKFPPDLIIEPKLTDLKIDLKEFVLRRVGNPTFNIAVEGESVQSLGDQMKETLRTMIKNAEPDIKKRANEAIAQALKEGRGNISASALFKIAPPEEKK